MPKKQKRTEQEIHDMIVSDARFPLGCKDFEPDFTLNERAPGSGGGSGESANWGVRETRNAETWAPACASAFREAVDRARRKFDIAWPLWGTRADLFALRVGAP